MFHYKPVFPLLLVLFSSNLFAQNFSISGYVRAAESGEELLYANVGVPALNVGVATNEYGYYSLSLPAGEHVISFSYIGYDTKYDTINLSENTRLDVELRTEKAALATEVVITD